MAGPLGAQVLIDAAPELDFITDPLVVELEILKNHVELLLLNGRRRHRVSR